MDLQKASTFLPDKQVINFEVGKKGAKRIWLEESDLYVTREDGIKEIYAGFPIIGETLKK